VTTWTIADYESMSWHDARIYGLALRADNWEFVLDLDYIVEWVSPAGNPSQVRFRVAPCTLVFENASEVSVHLDLGGSSTIEVDRIERSDPRELRAGIVDWAWTLRLHGTGRLLLRATGFRQTTRREPILVTEQSLSLEQRGEVGF
jgi:hypothetical protein